MKKTLEEILNPCSKTRQEKMEDGIYVCNKVAKKGLRRYCRKMMYLKIQSDYIRCLRKGKDQCKTEKCKDSVHDQIRLATLQLLEKERTLHKT
jgi:hypothetical protein